MSDAKCMTFLLFNYLLITLVQFKQSQQLCVILSLDFGWTIAKMYQLKMDCFIYSVITTNIHIMSYPLSDHGQYELQGVSY